MMKETFELSADELSTLTRYGLDAQRLCGCSVREYGFGERVFREDSPCDRIFVVLGGKAKVEVTAANGKNIILCFYVSEGLMGELELFAGAERSCSSVTAVSELHCLAIPVDCNRTYLEENLTFTKIAASELARKLLESSHLAMDSALYPAEVRLCRYILAAAEHGCFRDVMTDVAGSIGVSYRHLYRMLGKLCRDGILEKTGSGYLIKEPERLKMLCQQH